MCRFGLSTSNASLPSWKLTRMWRRRLCHADQGGALIETRSKSRKEQPRGIGWRPPTGHWRREKHADNNTGISTRGLDEPHTGITHIGTNCPSLELQISRLPPARRPKAPRPNARTKKADVQARRDLEHKCVIKPAGLRFRCRSSRSVTSHMHLY